MNLESDDLTVGEAAAVLRISDQTVRHWIKEGRIQAFKNAGGRWRISHGEVQRARGLRQIPEMGETSGSDAESSDV